MLGRFQVAFPVAGYEWSVRNVRTRLGNNGNSVRAVGTAPYALRKLSSNKGYLKFFG